MGPEERLGATCLGHVKFYVCDNKPARFIGCCSINPCNTKDGGCPQDKLQPAAFDQSRFDKITPQGCISSDSATAWYTCALSSPPFMGCCAENACQKTGCPADALRPARLSDNRDDAAVFQRGPAISSRTSSTSTATISSVTRHDTDVQAATQTPTSEPSDGARAAQGGSPGRLSNGTVAGFCVGSTIGAIALCGLLFLLFRTVSRMRKRKLEPHLDGDQPSSYPQQYGFSPDLHSVVPHEPDMAIYESPQIPHQPLSAGSAIFPLGWSSCHGTPTGYQTPPIHSAATAVELPATTSHVSSASMGDKTVSEMGYGETGKRVGEGAGTRASLEARPNNPVELEDPNTYYTRVKETRGLAE